MSNLAESDLYEVVLGYGDIHTDTVFVSADESNVIEVARAASVQRGGGYAQQYAVHRIERLGTLYQEDSATIPAIQPGGIS